MPFVSIVLDFDRNELGIVLDMLKRIVWMGAVRSFCDLAALAHFDGYFIEQIIELIGSPSYGYGV